MYVRAALCCENKLTSGVYTYGGHVAARDRGARVYRRRNEISQIELPAPYTDGGSVYRGSVRGCGKGNAYRVIGLRARRPRSVQSRTSRPGSGAPFRRKTLYNLYGIRIPC